VVHFETAANTLVCLDGTIGLSRGRNILSAECADVSAIVGREMVGNWVEGFEESYEPHPETGCVGSGCRYVNILGQGVLLTVLDDRICMLVG
jgi:hypothetical protein